ncbi:MAG: alanine--tRNA ligase [Candidatus Kapaibacteriota bacterium]
MTTTNKMTAKEIRQSFLDFFKTKGHRIVPSAPVVPHNDPTLLFTNAGMNQFKDVFLGLGERDYKRAADTQKCIRVSGKHNDLEEVGVDTYHHTFFEMLGNWSFGDYYKEEAIQWAWELLTDVWKLPKERLYATVYKTDDEAFEIWKRYLPESHIQRFGEKDNFWEMGETGPCGPCSEIHFDRTDDFSGANLVNAGSPDVIEIWNLVFIQYNRNAQGELEPLKAKHVDTGMGFERIVSVIQGTKSNYDTDIFMPIIQKISELSGKKYNAELESKDGIAMRVIADHLRTLSFAIADGALPGNEGRSYVLRRILRRASRFARNLGFNEPLIYKLVPVLIDTLGDVFPELIQEQNTIERVIKAEEESFLVTLERGLAKVEEIINSNAESNHIISGKDAFLLYDTFGFPLDLTQLIARERGFTVDTEEFEKYMEEQRDRSRSARKVNSTEVINIEGEYTTIFTGYNELKTSAKIIYIDENKVILDKTPFYAESGGQVSDTGTLTINNEVYNVLDIQKVGNGRIHICEREVIAKVGDEAIAAVDEWRRNNIMRNHSATHLLHEALKETLGNHIKQAGSLVSPDYLRFDFNHFEKVSSDDLGKIEEIVNEKIFSKFPVKTEELPLEKAKQNPKIKMFFGDKYGDIVRAVTMDENFSIELCGGTHVKNTSEIGIFKIINEAGIAAGVRRIEAITGPAVEKYIKQINSEIKKKEAEKEELIEKIKQLEKVIASNKMQELSSEVEQLINNSKKVNGIKIITTELPETDIDTLRNLGDEIRNKMAKEGIALLTTINDGKVQLCCVVTDDLKDKYPAGKLVGFAAKFLGGGGGGKAHLATAGAKDISKVNELLQKFPEMIFS